MRLLHQDLYLQGSTFSSDFKLGRQEKERLDETQKYSDFDAEITQQLEYLLKKVVSSIEARSAALFLSGKQDIILAKTQGNKQSFVLNEVDELLLFVGESIDNGDYFFEPILSNDHVIGYLSVKIENSDCTDDTQSVIHAYSALFAQKLKLAFKEARLQKNRERLKKKEQELKKAQQYNDNLISITSHDLSSPLNAISGYLELMNDCLSQDSDRRHTMLQNYHQRMESGVRDVMDILNQLSEISEIERGVETIEMAEVNLSWVAKQVFELMEGKAIEKTINFEFTRSEYSTYIKADIVKLKRVLQNLISNAIKYTPHEGNVTVVVAEKENQALLKVKDNGKGIPESHYSKIFAPFVKLDETIDNDSSTGLGLYVASYFTDLMNGEITVESKEQEGSVFTVRFPKVNVNYMEHRQAG